MTDIFKPLPELPGWARRAVNLASPRLGAEAVACSDDFFAPMARMLADAPPVWKTGLYDENGKWMDGWEGRRRRDGGHDWCVVRLGGPARIRGVDIDTAFFTGNYPPAASIRAAAGEEMPQDDSGWTEILPATALGPDAHHFVEIASGEAWRWIRLDMLPDGGIARLRLYGDPVPDWSSAGEVPELSALRNGGRAIAWNDAHYGNVWAVLSEGRGASMADGWETRRRREPGHDWLIVALGARGVIERIEIDTCHFKGNFPDAASVQAADVGWGTEESLATQAMFWEEVLGWRKLGPDAVHVFEGAELAALGPVSHVKLAIHPDGGVSRFRVYGRLV